jgi:primosomal protein N''
MRRLVGKIFNRFFSEIDSPMEKLREVRDSYRALNVEIYGEKMASLLNDW